MQHLQQLQQSPSGETTGGVLVTGVRARGASAAAGVRSSYWPRRLRRNATIAAAGAAVMAVVYAGSTQDASGVHRFSLATAYAAAALLAWALLLGPWYVRRGRRPPKSTDLRRDVGLWCTAFAVAHTVAGLRVHLKGDVVAYFFRRPSHAGAWWPRFDAFGAVNDTGLAAVLLLLLLALVSNDRALRALGAARWKRVQRSTYVVVALVAVHALVYPVLERRAWPAVAACALLFAVVAAAQLDGRRRYAAVVARGRVVDVA